MTSHCLFEKQKTFETWLASAGWSLWWTDRSQTFSGPENGDWLYASAQCKLCGSKSLNEISSGNHVLRPFHLKTLKRAPFEVKRLVFRYFSRRMLALFAKGKSPDKLIVSKEDLTCCFQFYFWSLNIKTLNPKLTKFSKPLLLTMKSQKVQTFFIRSFPSNELVR